MILSYTQPPLKILQRENEQLVSDMEKIKKFNDYAETKKVKARDAAISLKNDITSHGISYS
jgi:hypothetical protein